MVREATLSRRQFVGAMGCAAAAAALGLCAPSEAKASWNDRYITLAGHSIRCRADVTYPSPSGSVRGTATTATVNGESLHMGAYLVLYNGYGTSIGSRLIYSDGPVSSISASRDTTAVSGLDFRTMAVSYVFNTATQSYDDNFYDPAWSPYITAYSDEPYQVNSWGATYGPVTGLRTWGFLPDLVAVEGEGGVFGYVYREQFVPPQAANPEEAAAFFSEPQVLYAPVYDCEGAEQVDVFAVQYGGR